MLPSVFVCRFVERPCKMRPLTRNEGETKRFFPRSTVKEKLRNKKKKNKEKEKPTNKRVGCANYRDIQRTHIYSSITIYDFHFVQYLILRREKGRERTRKREKGRERKGEKAIKSIY